MNYEGRDYVWIDCGSGSGVLSIAAMRLGARFVHLFDLNEDELGLARELFVLNGYREGEHFHLHQGSLRDGEFVRREAAGIAAQAVRLDARVAIISNIGDWPQDFNVTNRHTLAFIRNIPQTVLFLGGGYPFYDVSRNIEVVGEDVEALREHGFVTHAEQIMVPDIYAIMSLSAPRNGGEDPSRKPAMAPGSAVRPQADNAANALKGGIDLNPRHIALTGGASRSDFELGFDAVILERLRGASGLSPVITEMAPLESLGAFFQQAVR